MAANNSGMQKEYFRFAQANLQKCKVATLTFLENFEKSGLDIALIQEPYTGSWGFLKPFKCKCTIFQKRDQNADVPVKAAIVVSKNFEENPILLHKFSDHACVFVEFKMGNDVLTVGSIYCEPTESIERNFQGLMNLGRTGKIFSTLIASDVNAKSIWWGSPKNDRRGDEVVDLLSQHNLNVLNNGNVPTFETTRNGIYFSNIIDVTISSDNMINRVTNWRVDRDISPMSDHNAILFELKVNNANEICDRETTFLYKTNKANWEKFAKSILDDISQGNVTTESIKELRDQYDIDNAVSKINDIINNACRKSIPIAKRSNRLTFNPWWNDNLENLKKELIRAKRKLVNSAKNRRTEVTLPAYLLLKDKYKAEIARAKSESWMQFCSKQNKENIWSTLKRITKKHNFMQPETVNFNGNVTENAKETAAAFLDHFFQPDNSVNDSPEQSHIRVSIGNYNDRTTSDVDFTFGEINDILKNISSSKAPGRDHLTADICCKVFETIPQHFVELFNACLRIGCFPTIWKIARVKVIPKPNKMNYNDVGSYRPIGLLPIFGKVLEKLMIDRIFWHLQKNKQLSENQFGFTPQKSTEQALSCAVQKIESYLTTKSHVVVISLDIKGAFDNAWWPFILHQLIGKGCPSNLVHLVKHYFSDRLVETVYAGERASKSSSKGCVQGSACGPVFWNLIIDDLLQSSFDANTHIQAFADDVLLIIGHKNLDALERTCNQTLETVAKWGLKAKLQFSEEKTNVLFFTRSRQVTRPKLVMNNVDLEYSRDFKILGVVLDDKLSWSKHVDMIAKKTTGVVKKLMGMARPTWGLKPEILSTINTAIIEPIATYGASVWGKAMETKSARRKLGSVQRMIGLRIAKAYRTTSLTSVQTIAGLTPLHFKIHEKMTLDKVKRTGHHPNLPNDREYQGTVPHTAHPHPSLRTGASVRYSESVSETDREPFEIYTDGSKMDNKVGAAYVVYNNRREIAHKILPMDEYCSVYQAELVAITESLEWVIKSRPQTSRLTVLSDSKSALQSLEDRRTCNPIVFSIQNQIRKLQELNVYCEFAWVRGHAGITGNERADHLAKQAASNTSRRKVFNEFPLSYAKAITRQETLESWEEEYKNSTTGGVTKLFFQNIKQALEFRKHHNISFELTQALTGHGALKHYLHRFKIIQSPVCPCDDTSEQTVAHVLAACHMFHRERFKLERRLRVASLTMDDISSSINDKAQSPVIVQYITSIFRKLIEDNWKASGGRPTNRNQNSAP